MGRGRVWTELPWWDSQGGNTEQSGRLVLGKASGRCFPLWAHPGGPGTGHNESVVGFWPKGVPVGSVLGGKRPEKGVLGHCRDLQLEGGEAEEERSLPVHHRRWEARVPSPAWQPDPWGQTHPSVFPHPEPSCRRCAPRVISKPWRASNSEPTGAPCPQRMGTSRVSV